LRFTNGKEYDAPKGFIRRFFQSIFKDKFIDYQLKNKKKKGLFG